MNKVFTFMRESGPARFFIPVGIFLLIFGIVVFIINWNNQNYIKIQATVVKIELAEAAYTDSDGHQVDETYNVDIIYTVNGVKYNNVLEGISKCKEGDKLTIYYDPKDPTKITQSKSLIIPIVMIIGGLASLVGGIISAINAIKKSRKMKEQERSWENAK